MSGFLAHLVARATQRGPRLERRQPALFEPRAARPGMSASEASARANESDDEGAAARAAPASPAFAMDRPMPERQPAPRHASARDAAGRSAVVDTRSAVGESQRVIAQARTSDPHRDTSQVIPRESEDLGFAQRAPRMDRSVAARSTKEHDDFAPASKHGGPAPVETRAIVTTAPPARRDAPLDREIAPVRKAATADANRLPDLPLRRVTAAQPMQVAQAVQLARAAAQRVDASVRSAGSEKTVQITIGRVEVRAVTTPERGAPRPAKTAPARLSLDDYLRERSRGTR